MAKINEDEMTEDTNTDTTTEAPKRERVAQLPRPDATVTYQEWEEIINANFPELLFSAEVGLATLAQILITDITNPFAVVLVDVPSAGKTITINFFADIEELTYATDRFTPASFVSNAANVSKDKLKDVDLLPRIQYKMFLIRDLATLFSKRDDDLNECLGILTRILDGEGFNTDSGIHGRRQYVGEYLFMLLAASTPISPRVWNLMGNLGSRLFFLNMHAKDKTDAELAAQLGSTAYKAKEKVCQTATADLLKTLWSQHPKGVQWDNAQDSNELKIIIARSARLLARLRGVINVWKQRDESGQEFSFTTPTVEKPDRINQLFYNLARGHALVNGRKQLETDDVRVVVELAVDSAPTMRTRLLRGLFEHNGQLRTSEVETLLHCSKPTALKEMQTLKILGICRLDKVESGAVGEPERVLMIADEFSWFLSDECKLIRQGVKRIDKANLTS